MSNLEKKSLLQLNFIAPSIQVNQQMEQTANEEDSQNEFDFYQIKQQYNQTFNPSSFSPNHPRKKKYGYAIQNWCASNYEFGQFDNSSDQKSSYSTSPPRRLSKQTLKQMEEQNEASQKNNFTIINKKLGDKNSILLSRKLSSSTTDGQYSKNPYNFYKIDLNLSESEQCSSMSSQNTDSARVSPQYRCFQNRQFSFSSDVSQISGNSMFGGPVGAFTQIKVSPFGQTEEKVSDQNYQQRSYTMEQNIQNYESSEMLSPQIQIPQEVLQQAQKRFGGIKNFKNHPSIRRLQIEYNTFEQKALFDGTAVKNAIEKNKSPTQAKKSPFSPRNRIRSEDDSVTSFASTAKLMEIDADLQKIKRKTSCQANSNCAGATQIKEQYQQQKVVQTNIPTGPDTLIPPYVLKRSQVQDYDKFLDEQLINRRHSQDFIYNQTPSSYLVQKISDQTTLQQTKNSLKCNSGMDSITVVKMNKN